MHHAIQTKKELVVRVSRPAPFAKTYTAGREDKRTNNKTMKNNVAAGYQGAVKIELFVIERPTG